MRQTVWQRLISWWGRRNGGGGPSPQILDEHHVGQIERATREDATRDEASGGVGSRTLCAHSMDSGSSTQVHGPSFDRVARTELDPVLASGSAQSAAILEFPERVLDEYTIEDELEEFLAADRDPITADPRFREDLRERLWALVQDGVIARLRNH
jgi:hypothetical protein